jgi:hypothetical protein
LGPFLYAAALSQGRLPDVPAELALGFDGNTLECAGVPDDPNSWEDLITAGCPGPSAELGLALGSESLLDLFNSLGFYDAPSIRMPTAISNEAPAAIAIPEAATIGQGDLTISPLQLALAASILSSGGVIPAPQLALAVSGQELGSDSLPALGESWQVFSGQAASAAALGLKFKGMPIWQTQATAINGPKQTITWYVAGTLGETEIPMVVVVLLEIDYPALAETIGQAVLRAAMEK